MKKLKLNLQHLEGIEVLTREQLKKVMGGDTGSSSNNCPARPCSVVDTNGKSHPGTCGYLIASAGSWGVANICECVTDLGFYTLPIGTASQCYTG